MLRQRKIVKSIRNVWAWEQCVQGETGRAGGALRRWVGQGITALRPPGSRNCRRQILRPNAASTAFPRTPLAPNSRVIPCLVLVPSYCGLKSEKELRNSGTEENSAVGGVVSKWRIHEKSRRRRLNFGLPRSRPVTMAFSRIVAPPGVSRWFGCLDIRSVQENVQKEKKSRSIVIKSSSYRFFRDFALSLTHSFGRSLPFHGLLCCASPFGSRACGFFFVFVVVRVVIIYWR